ncbi:MAG TPA: NfeD family protein [Jatrophihabitans sp.]|nr:NfeD family protein [Jatrophihabitans sp.]
MHAWLIWLIIAAGLAGAEAMSLDLVLIMLAGGAAGGAVTAGLGAPPPVQVLIAIVVALGLLLGVRPVARRHLLAHEHRTGTDALVGRSAIVLSRVDAHGGRVRLNGGEWSARALDEAQVIEAGSTVQVIQISGATAVVWHSGG